MNVPSWAGFVGDFPDDQVEEGGDIKVFGGRNVALALGEMLAGLGCDRISEPWIVSDVGWEFDLHDQGRNRFLCRVQSFHPVFWLLFEDASCSKKSVVAHVDLWRKFASALEQDPRFRKILWRSFEEGPPDWEEVEAAEDPPGRTFDQDFPPSDITPQRARAGCLSYLPFLIWAWFLTSGIVSLIVGLNSNSHKERQEDIVAGVGLIALCLVLPVAVVLEAIKRRLRRTKAE